jgi:hypothetical protein
MALIRSRFHYGLPAAPVSRETKDTNLTPRRKGAKERCAKDAKNQLLCEKPLRLLRLNRPFPTLPRKFPHMTQNFLTVTGQFSERMQ